MNVSMMRCPVKSHKPSRRESFVVVAAVSVHCCDCDDVGVDAVVAAAFVVAVVQQLIPTNPCCRHAHQTACLTLKTYKNKAKKRLFYKLKN